MRSKLTTIILIGMVLGILVGYACHILWPDPKIAKGIADYISLLTDIFLRLIKMIIAPLVFSTLVVGVAHMGDTKAVGRIGGCAGRDQSQGHLTFDEGVCRASRAALDR
jgi:Na+/H+-dicarboxylate symporter